MLRGALALSDDPVEELSARDELHHEVYAGLRVVDVEQLDDVRVVDALEDLHLWGDAGR